MPDVHCQLGDGIFYHQNSPIQSLDQTVICQVLLSFEVIIVDHSDRLREGQRI